VSELQSLHIMFKRATETVKVVPESVLSNGGNLLGTHNQGGGVISEGVISVHPMGNRPTVFFAFTLK